MVDEASPLLDDELVTRLVEEADTERIFTPSPQRVRDIVEIATDTRSRLRLVELMGAQNDRSKLVDIVVDALEDAGDRLEGRADMTNATIELLDRSVLPVSTAALLSGVGLLVSTGNRVGSVALLACGAFGLAIAAFGRIRLKAYESSGKVAAKKIRRLSGDIRSQS